MTWMAWVCCTACGHEWYRESVEDIGAFVPIDCEVCRARSFDVLDHSRHERRTKATAVLVAA